MRREGPGLGGIALVETARRLLGDRACVRRRGRAARGGARSAGRRDPPSAARVMSAVASGVVRLAGRTSTGESDQTPSRAGHDEGQRDRGGAQEEAASIRALHVIEGDGELGRCVGRVALGAGGVHTSECEPRSQRNTNFAARELRRAGSRAEPGPAFRRSSSGLAPPQTL